MCTVSIIIPAFNEERYISATLEAIAQNPPPCSYEVIVVDNGSSDATVDIVGLSQATLIHCPVGTVAAVRNRGVAESSGGVLVFIDADVQVSPGWHREMVSVIEGFSDKPLWVTGSRCLPPDDTFWLNRYWFSFLNQYEAPYINSGHLITSRELFDLVGGFSEALETAEDYDFCMKAKAVDAQLTNNNQLSVIHYGYPTTMLAFIKRERWHGSEDVQSIAAFKASKMAWMALLQLLVLAVCLVGVMVLGVIVVPMYLILSFGLCFALALYKFKSLNGRSLVVTPFVFYLYLTGRGLSLIDRFVALLVKR